MSVNLLKTRSAILSLRISQNNLFKCCYATSVKKGILSDLDVDDVPTYDAPAKYSEEDLKKIRNIAGISQRDRNLLNDEKPYTESMHWTHDTVGYHKKMIGKYGMGAVEVSPGIAWPTKEEIEDKKEYERVKYPVSIYESWKKFEEQKKEEALAIKKREEQIEAVMANFGKWRAALEAKKKKQEDALLEAKRKKEAVLQEVRDQLGYYIDPRDDRFREILEERELEDKKAKKKMKKQKMADKRAAILANMEQKMLEKQQAEEDDDDLDEASGELSDNGGNDDVPKDEK